MWKRLWTLSKSVRMLISLFQRFISTAANSLQYGSGYVKALPFKTIKIDTNWAYTNGRLKSAKITKSRNFYSLLLVTGLAKLCGILTAAQHLFHLKMLTREELQHLCLHQIIFTNVVITIQSYWKHQTRFLWMNERRGLFCSLQWIYTFLSKTVKAQLDYKPYINDSFCIQEVRELCLVITEDHFFFACILAWHLWDVESILQVNFSFGIIFLC